jgi:hypothetical protein
MLGKGGCGMAYKAVLNDGSMCGRQAAPGRCTASAFVRSKKEFSHHIAVMSLLRHPT